MQRLLRTRHLQTKLRISHPGDIHEREADRLAEEVMRMPEPGVIQRSTRRSKPAEVWVRASPL